MNLHRRDKAIFASETAGDCLSFLAAEDPKQPFVIPKEKLARRCFLENKNRFSELECLGMVGGDFNLHSLCNEISGSATQLITKDLHVRFERYPEWRSLSLSGGQDLYIVAGFSKLLPPAYDWPMTLPVEPQPEIKDLEIADNHCHLSALGATFVFNWFYLHNAVPFDAPLVNLAHQYQKSIKRYRSEAEYHLLRNSSLICIYLRRYLFWRTKGRQCKLMNFGIKRFPQLEVALPHLSFRLREAIENLPCGIPSDKSLTDYVTGEREISYIYGERFFLSECVHRFQSWPTEDKVAFYLYLILKRFIASFFIQNNEWFGFSNFERFERASDLFLKENKTIKRLRWSNSLREIGEDSRLMKCEVRMAPKSSNALLQSNLNLLSGCQRNLSTSSRKVSLPKLGIVIHYIKQSDPRTDASFPQIFNITQPRCWRLIQKYSAETSKCLVPLLLSPPRHGSIPVVGIDAANEEYKCRPEVFAPFYRRLRALRRPWPAPNLGFTFHAGEDFLSLADGLRAIFEAIEFLELGPNDRIGHASALGTSPDKYFLLKGQEVSQSLQDRLDDYCFLYQLLSAPKRNLSLRHMRRLTREINRLINEIYGSGQLDDYLQMIHLKADYPEIYREYDSNKTLKKYKAIGKGYYFSSKAEAKTARKNPEALRLIHLYHYSRSVREKGNQVDSKPILPFYQSAVKKAQVVLKDMIITAGICIETNPTSNYLIGPFVDFEDIPVFSFAGLNKSDPLRMDVPFCIGTDDPGLFSITLRNEYASVLYTLKAKRKKNITDTMKAIAETSMQRSFIK